MNQKIELTVNGETRQVTTLPERTLLDVLREDLHLTGTKYGCGEGQCRACTVLLDGKPVRSCQTEVQEAAGHKVETIESLATSDRLHPVQEAFLAEGAIQCGYCVPGAIMTAVGLLRKNPRPTEPELVDFMNGNLCRCCNYPNLLNALRRAAGVPRKEGAP